MYQREYPATGIIDELLRDDLLPAILFRTSRRQCDNDVERLGRSRVAQLGFRDQKALRTEIRSIFAIAANSHEDAD